MSETIQSLYPPVVDSYMPPFIKTFDDENEVDTTSGRIYFIFSDYQVIDHRLSMQVIVNDQKTNTNVLNPNAEGISASGIKTCQFIPADEGTSEYARHMYYITLSATDFKGGEIQQGQYYRVQMRLMDDYSSQSVQYSEWSTVCLIKAIAQPIVYIDLANNSTVTTQSLSLAGHIDFEDIDDENAKSYQLKLYKIENNVRELVESTDILLFNKFDKSNNWSYRLKTRLIDGEDYVLIFNYTTRNLYKETKEYAFTIALPQQNINLVMTAEADNNNGLVKLTVKPKPPLVLLPADQYFVILRSDSNSKFGIIEEIYLGLILKTDEEVVWIDKALESDVYYQYYIQLVDAQGSRVSVLSPVTPETLLVSFDEQFLTTDSKQLRITLNNQISSFKRNIQESKTDTLGGEFPWIRRNGAAKYRSFSISGTIAYDMDNDEQQYIPPYTSAEIAELEEFVSLASKNIYGQFAERNSLLEDNNYKSADSPYLSDRENIYLERKFREAVMDFLYGTSVKLYRSPTEGNILVRLMNVSLSPKNELGKMIYDFSCEAVEVAEYTLENCNTYGVQYLGSPLFGGVSYYNYRIVVNRQGGI